MGVPRTAFDVRRDARGVPCRILGFRGYQVLGYVHSEVEQNGIAPSYAMIRDALGFSQDCDVRAVVVRLEQRGLLKREGKGRVRRIRLVVDNAQ